MKYILLESNKFSSNALSLFSKLSNIIRIYIESGLKVRDFEIELVEKTKDIDLNDSLIIINSQEYYKYLTKVKKINPTIGSIIPLNFNTLSIKDNCNCIYLPDSDKVLLNDKDKKEEQIILDQILSYFNNKYEEIGKDIIKVEWYPLNLNNIKLTLNRLKTYKILTVDIETFSLKFYSAGLGSIGFGIDQHRGSAFTIDLRNNKETVKEIRLLLKEFFISYTGKLVFHNGSFDITVLIYQLFMKDINDYEGLLYGLDVMTRDYEDTKLLAYCYINSCAIYSLSLKNLALEFAGNYAIEEISDINKIPKKKLLKYNLIDCLSTYYLWNKYSLDKIREQEGYDNVYDLILKPSLKVIIHTQLVGFPIDKTKTEELLIELENKSKDLINKINNNIHVKEYVKYNKIKQLTDRDNLLTIRYDKAYNKRLERYEPSDPNIETKTLSKIRRELKDIKNSLTNIILCDIKDIYNYISKEDIAMFNSGSPSQLNELLIDRMRLPILKTTDKGSPTLGKNILEDYIKLNLDQDIKEFLNNLILKKEIDKIINSFLIPWLDILQLTDQGYKLYGDFNIGSTKSGRLSSSSPNLQQLPSNSTYGKAIKACSIITNKDWIMIGADFALV